MNEKKYILYVGLNDKDTKKQLITTNNAKKIIQHELFKNGIQGYTIYKGDGLYKHESGAITIEKTFIIELIYIDDKIVNQVIEQLKKVLNQESILKQTQNINISFE